MYTLTFEAESYFLYTGERTWLLVWYTLVRLLQVQLQFMSITGDFIWYSKIYFYIIFLALDGSVKACFRPGRKKILEPCQDTHSWSYVVPFKEMWTQQLISPDGFKLVKD